MKPALAVVPSVKFKSVQSTQDLEVDDLILALDDILQDSKVYEISLSLFLDKLCIIPN
jgi:hypothetical protein